VGAEEAAHVEQALLGVHLGAVFHFFQALFAHHVDGNLDQVSDHRLDIAADVTDLGKLRGFDLQERRLVSLARRRAISVFPTPVGPIMMMFLA